ncbi:ABC transporter ATP-binding protein [Schauerella aestuarii]|uniref:ABC transporter ATP-binding protein n=1 Tax=Schauerella aestuarii TaxID=2511204 RepID=UPI00136E4275|nr:ABC transporter ATP-binding protein [Achromobacter aestuarii]MYZ45210.1 ABC transporter ATP-binding protein [Achromobacter aestuarii]
MLELKGVNAHYGKLHVLHDLSLSVPEGQRVGVFGHNGAGKTTMLRACLGDLEGCDGDVRYRNQPIRAGEVHHNVAYGMAFVPQGNNVFRELQVEQNLAIAGLKHDATARKRAFDEVYALFPLLAERSEQVAGSLSGGQQQMLALGMALMTQPSILLLDEPTIGLAPVIVRDVLATVTEINRTRGTTVVIVEQNVQATLQNVDRAVVIKSGRVIYDGASAELLKQESLWDLF